MATSGTVGNIVLDLATILEHAIRRCRVPTSVQTPEVVQLMLSNLQRLLNELSSLGINLWCVEKIIVGLHKFQESYQLPAGTVDVLNAFLRTSPSVGGTLSSSDGQGIGPLQDGDVTTYVTQSSTGGNFKLVFSAATAVRTVGLLHKGTATRSLVFETSPDNVVWTVVRSVGTKTYSEGEWIWNDIDPTREALYFRVRDTLTNASLSAYEFYASGGGTEIAAARLNRDQFTNMPQKFFSGRPLQYWFDRQVTQAVLHLWPSPDDIYTQYVVWRHRLVQDVGTDLTLEIEVPIKWQEAIFSGLALRTALELPQVDVQLIPILKALYKEALSIVETDEYDNSVIQLAPNIRHYTRGTGGRR